MSNGRTRIRTGVYGSEARHTIQAILYAPPLSDVCFSYYTSYFYTR